MASNINIVSKVLLGVGLVLPGALLLPLVDMEAKTLSTVNANLVEGPFVGAEWISVDSGSLPIYADYLPVFRLSFNLDLEPGNTASLLFGLDDPRLMDRNMNIYGLENKPGESYIRLEIETVGVAQSKNSDGIGLAVDSIHLYRVGYHPNDNPKKPVASFPVPNLKYKNDKIEIAENLGHTDIFVNGEKVGYIGINPVGNGGDYLAFPVLAGIGVDIPEGSTATISEIAVNNFREPRNEVAKIDGSHSQSKALKFPVKGMPEMRTTVALNPDKKVGKATVNATARGIYDLYVNGNRVNEEYYLPGSTQYNKTHLYHTFDITDRLKSGDNEVRVQLGEGWWSGPSTFVGENWNFYGDRQAFLGEITVNYTDGSSERYVTSPDSWEYSVDGPLVVGSFFQGEIFDARKAEGGLGFKEREWQQAVALPEKESLAPVAGGWDNVQMLPTFGDRVLPIDTLTALSVSEPRPGVYLYDLGQNMAAVPHITFSGLKPGQEVTIRHGEVLYPDMPQYEPNVGMVMTENLRAAMCRDKYIASGEAVETFSPRHTLHGYRYLELTGLDSPLPVEAVRSIPVSSVHGFNAHFECSDSLVNRLWENIKWSTLSNFISIPTDCPQRNERLGWMGDISVYSPTATKIADVSALLRQYLRTIRDCQEENGRFPDVAPTGFGFGGFLWGSAGITVPWEYYAQYGDKEVLREHYPAMQRYIDYILRETIEPSTNVLVQNRAWGDLGDWLSPEYEKVDKSLLWECYLIYDLTIMADVARILGFDEDAARYDALASQRKKFFADTYVDPDTEKTRWSAFDGSRNGSLVDTQSSYALPLAMGIYDTPRFRENFVATIERENHADDGTVCPPYSLMTGFIGTAWVLEALSRIERDDLAYAMLTSTNYPSWLYPVTQGATTVWERLNSYTHKDGFGSNNSMNSFNHYSFGSVGNWLLTRCLGIKINPDGEVTVDPIPDPTGRITYARGWLDTPKGRVEGSWHREGDKIIYDTKKP
ncbi:MAG: glycoside hydrolase family 78 protein [Muribaculaceae bacterium]|nr:glycoside hydrolase family 78 protein [Muribaculaceae bacterium]